MDVLFALRTKSIEIGIIVFATISQDTRAELLEHLLERISMLTEYDSRAIHTMYAGILEGANHSFKTTNILDKIQNNNPSVG